MKVLQSVPVDNSIWRDFLEHPGYAILVDRLQKVADNFSNRYSSAGATGEIDNIWRAYGAHSAAQDIVLAVRTYPTKPS